MENIDCHSDLKSNYEKYYDIINLEYFKIRDQFDKINNLYDQMNMYKLNTENDTTINEYLNSTYTIDKNIRLYFQTIKELHHELNIYFDDFTDNATDLTEAADLEKYQHNLDKISEKISSTIEEHADLDKSLSNIQREHTNFVNNISHKNF